MVTGAYQDNPAPIGVGRALGYRDDGALDPAGHQALALGRYRTREDQLSYRSSFYQAAGLNGPATGRRAG